MRIALISPYSGAPMRGNITTVRRINRFLVLAGVVTLNLATDSLSVSEMELRLAEFKPDLIHCFHAHSCGAISRQLAERFKVPYIITITGSDVHDPLQRNHPETVTAIEAAQGVVCFSDSDADALSAYIPGIGARISVAPQGVEPIACDGKATFDLDPDAFILLLPAALRPVKQVEFPIRSLAQLVQHDPTLRLVIAGGVIDREYTASISRMLCETTYATWLGEVPYEQMGNLYTRADLVLNCSRSESMPNSLMEAMALGRPVLAANIPGNRSLVRHGQNGWLYDNVEDFRKLAVQIRRNTALREQVGVRAQGFMMANFSPQQEAGRYLSIYRRLVL
ncbi:MAG: glycosyltransferase [Geobacteraceae bacterium]|nr:glycosyltransferase [Geobacteraceae bacterium]